MKKDFWVSWICALLMYGSVYAATNSTGATEKADANGDRLTKTNDNSPEAIYYGTWSETNDPSFYENDQHLSNRPYANCVFTFNKSIVRWIGSKGNNHGFADVYIDGVFQKTIDTYSDKVLTKQVLFEKKGLSNDKIHTINIVVKEEKNAKSSGYYQDIDYFESLEPVDFRKQYREAAASEFENIISGTKSYLAPDTWVPVSNKANVPANGVILLPGTFNDCFTRNIDYLNHCFASPTYCDGIGWTKWLPGSNEGRMLQGAGNSLRWGERSDMRDIVNTIVNKIESRQRADGYSNYYPESESYACLEGGNSERKNYDRVFWTRGLLDAGRVGNAKAYTVLRKFYDWFNGCSYLGRMLNGGNSTNGHPGGGLVYFSPIGKSEDLVVTERYFVQDYWINELKNENPLCITYYQISNPHCYELLGIEALIYEYRATGAAKYIDAVKGAWKVYNESFEHIGGTTAICEGSIYPPKSRRLDPKRHTGETCGSVFWINANSKLLQLYPTEEKYATEIEKGIYNTLMACQDNKGYIRYHNFLYGVKDKPQCSNTCCENSAVGMIAKLPEHIYSIANDGIYVNLFAASTINWQQDNKNVTLVMNTDFPFNSDVTIRLSVEKRLKSNIRIRIPSWAVKNMPVKVNGRRVAVGKPGTYQSIKRKWSDGDEISFTLPMDFRLTAYTGYDQIEGHQRYALEYGPVLMAVAGPLDKKLGIQIIQPFDKPKSWLKPIPTKPLHFSIEGHPKYEYMPYWQIADETFTAFPIIGPLSIKGVRKFLDTTTVEIVSLRPGSETRYTTDGTEPTTNSPLYTGPIEIDHTATVAARTFSKGKPKSRTLTAFFHKVPLMAPTINYSNDSKSIEMKLPPLMSHGSIRYTTDGSEPTVNSTLYTEPISVPSQTTTIRARAFYKDNLSSSPVLFTVSAELEYPWPLPDIYLSDLKMVKGTSGWKTPQKDLSISETEMIISERHYKKGMGVHSESELIYNIKPEYKNFVAVVGIDDATGNRGGVIFQVYIDDMLVYHTPSIASHKPWSINVPIPDGSQKLKLIVTDGNQEYNHDWADWANAGFLK